MKRLSDDIGVKYSEWEDGECIFISSPTGSGKTYFVLNVLRPFLIERNRKALYLVNRCVLKDQIEKEVERIQLRTGEIRNPIDIKTYQSIEDSICCGEYREEENGTYKSFAENKMYEDYQQYKYVVCDECHYFLTDSNYNANTAISFRFIQEMFFDKIRIFMSATMGDIREYIKKDNRRRLSPQYTPFYKFCPPHQLYTDIDSARHSDAYDGYYRYYGFSIEKDYGYLDIEIVKNAGEIIDLINSGKNGGKWLIFVDSINFGINLEKELNQNSCDNGKQAVFISSGYKDDVKCLKEMKGITEQEMQSARVLIATSVLDNGINLRDTGLKNMVIMADTETEFIQMLGRKREDGGCLKLYIYRQDKNTFVRRREQAARRIKIANEYLKGFDELIQRDIDQMKIMPKAISWERHKKTELQLIKKRHIKVMRDIMEGHIRYEDARNVFCTFGGMLYVNFLAYQNLQNLYSYYENIIESMDKDGDDAFIREQLSWLGLAEDKVNDVLLGEIKVCRLRIIKALEEQMEKPSMTKDECKKFKLTIRGDLRVLVQSVDKNTEGWEKAERIIKYPDRPLTSTALEFLNKYCVVIIPFTVKEKDSMYTIECVDEKLLLKDRK